MQLLAIAMEHYANLRTSELAFTMPVTLNAADAARIKKFPGRVMMQRFVDCKFRVESYQ